MVIPGSWRIFAVAAALLPATAGSVQAEVRLPAVISDHMLLQQGVPARIWGWCSPGETVQVRFRGRSYTASAPLPGESGDWEVFLAPSEAGGPFRLEVRGSNTIAIEDVLVGDVWVASGQSNMDWSVPGVRGIRMRRSLRPTFPGSDSSRSPATWPTSRWRTWKGHGSLVLQSRSSISPLSATTSPVTCTGSWATPSA